MAVAVQKAREGKIVHLMTGCSFTTALMVKAQRVCPRDRHRHAVVNSKRKRNAQSVNLKYVFARLCEAREIHLDHILVLIARAIRIAASVRSLLYGGRITGRGTRVCVPLA